MLSNSPHSEFDAVWSYSHLTIEAGESWLYEEEDMVLVEIVLYAGSRYLQKVCLIGSDSESVLQ